MSVEAVNRFYEQVAADGALQKAFVQATGSRIVSFAAEHGHKFSERDLQTAADTLRARAQQLRAELSELHDNELEAVVGGATAAPVNKFMNGIGSDRIYNGLGEVFDALTISSSG